MASRNTLEAAKEIKNKMQENHPAAKLTIIDRSTTRRVGRTVAEKNGYQIIEDAGGVMVTVKETNFAILEVRICAECNTEFTTAAIGEHGTGECRECREKSTTDFKAALTESVKLEKARVASLDQMHRHQAE